MAGAKWAAGPAPDDQRDTPLVLSLSEGLGHACTVGGRCDEGGSSTPCATNGAAGCFSALQMPKNEAMQDS